MSLYQQIKEIFILPNAFEDWREYREELTNYLIKETDQVAMPLNFSGNIDLEEHLPTLAIIGAGECNDIDLKKLAEHFSRITLIDCNKEAMEQAIVTYELKDSKQIELLPVSLDGIVDRDYEAFCEELQTYVRLNQGIFNMEEFEEFALSKLTKICNKRRQGEIPLEPDTYDYIWCFGVHSQLQAMFSYICHAFLQNLKEMFPSPLNEFTNINRYLKSENDYFIPHFHDALLRSAKKAVFLGMEMHRTNDTEPVEGAYQAINDIRSRNLKVTESSICWPFYKDGNISYDMLIQKISL